MSALVIIILLILTGLLLIAVEFLVAPGITIAGIGGFLFIASGVYYGYTEFGSPIGHLIFLSTLVVTVGSIVLMLRSKTWKKTMLQTEIDSHVKAIREIGISVGNEGITTSRLTPIGKNKINDTFIEAKSQTGFIDQKVPVQVVKVDKTNVIVKPLNKK